LLDIVDALLNAELIMVRSDQVHHSWTQPGQARVKTTDASRQITSVRNVRYSSLVQALCHVYMPDLSIVYNLVYSSILHYVGNRDTIDGSIHAAYMQRRSPSMNPDASWPFALQA
jgi:hypothetical protein